MTVADFDQVRALIHQHAGISLGSAKRTMVHGRLSRRLRETGDHSFADYLKRLASLSGEAALAERQEFVNCLTTNLTSFFREKHHFQILATELVARRGERLRLWCNAASTGEEPYSMAMTAAEAIGPHPDVQIVASDIDTKVLEVAAQGVYDADSRGLDGECLRRHFLRGKGENSGSIRIRAERARLIEFRAFNLIEEHWSLGEPFDMVFCRNVMIYFDRQTQRRVLERMHRITKPAGLLFAGHSENFNHSSDLFRLRAQTVYERV